MSEIPEVFAIFEQKLAHVLSFTLREKGQKKAIEELLVYFSGIVERASKAESRIAELEAENEKIDYFFIRLRMFCIFARWDNPNTADEFYKVDAEIRDYLSEYKACIDELAVPDPIERQDDKSPNDTQTSTIVYGKESEE